MNTNLNFIRSDLLVQWYLDNKRELPWRKNRNPYEIWISEVMLQQTTVQAVIPYFNRFISKYPTVEHLANADLQNVYELWTGLGYYSRARNIHKASKLFAQTGFPKSYEQLIEYPGLGPYTARAVSSIAFDESVGVLDGNVIRVLCRFLGLQKQWWKPLIKAELQVYADHLATLHPSHIINQALMELGATICTPQKPACILCPWMKHCIARKQDLLEKLPLKKPRKKMEIWVWKPTLLIQKNKVALIKNDYAPFLKGQFIFPGEIKKSKQKPKNFQTKHTITHHQIFVQTQHSKKIKSVQNAKWIAIENIQQTNPSILLKKILFSTGLIKL